MISKEDMEKAAHLGALRQRVNEIVADLYIEGKEGRKAEGLLESYSEAILKEISEARADERAKTIAEIAAWADKNAFRGYWKNYWLIRRSDLWKFLDNLGLEESNE